MVSPLTHPGYAFYGIDEEIGVCTSAHEIPAALAYFFNAFVSYRPRAPQDRAEPRGNLVQYNRPFYVLSEPVFENLPD